MKRAIAILVAAAAVVTGVVFFLNRDDYSSKQLSYEVFVDVQYRSREGDYAQRATGVVTVDRTTTPDGQANYVYAVATGTQVEGINAVAEITMPPSLMVRCVENDRFAGGNEVVKDLGLLANDAMDQIKQAASSSSETEPEPYHFTFNGSGEFPRQLTFNLQFKKGQLDDFDDVVTGLAVSEPFSYRDPRTDQEITGRQRVLCVLQASTDDVIYLCSNFTASPDCSWASSFHIESQMRLIKDAKPVSLAELSESFDSLFAQMAFSNTPEIARTTTGLPVWALHSVAANDMTVAIASASIEGRPNFAVTATVGLVLLADSAVSAGTGLLETAGVIDWRYRGIPDYIGGGIGWSAAKGYEKATGKDVNEQAWRDIGGVAGDVAAMFIPSKALASGIKVGSGGVKIVKGLGLTGRKLRLSDRGLEIVKSSEFIDSAAVAGMTKAVRDIVTVGKSAWELGEIANDTEGRQSTGSDADRISGRTHDPDEFGRMLLDMIKDRDEELLRLLMTPTERDRNELLFWIWASEVEADDHNELAEFLAANYDLSLKGRRRFEALACREGIDLSGFAAIGDETKRAWDASFVENLAENYRVYADWKLADRDIAELGIDMDRASYSYSFFNRPDNFHVVFSVGSQLYHLAVEALLLADGWMITDDIHGISSHEDCSWESEALLSTKSRKPSTNARTPDDDNLENLKRELSLGANLAKDHVYKAALASPSDWVQATRDFDTPLSSELTSISRKHEIRITLVMQDGRVAFDTSVDPMTMKNQADRPEVLVAITRRETGTSLRRSSTGTTIYMAVPVVTGKDIAAIICVSKELR